MEWDADILHYYAFYMFIASFFITASNKLLIASAAGILVCSQIFQLVFDYTRGWDSSFHAYESFWTIDGYVRNLFYNGYHPIFPWICFFLLGMWLGRLDLNNQQTRKKVLFFSIAAAV